MNIEIIITAAVTLGILLVLWMLKGAMVTPAPVGEGQLITTVIRVTGGAPELQRTIDALVWVTQNGGPRSRVVIEDAGMDAETRKMAELLARDNESVSLCRKGDLLLHNG